MRSWLPFGKFGLFSLTGRRVWLSLSGKGKVDQEPWYYTGRCARQGAFPSVVCSQLLRLQDLSSHGSLLVSNNWCYGSAFTGKCSCGFWHGMLAAEVSLKQAFDSVNHELLWDLWLCEILARIVGLLTGLCSRTESTVKCGSSCKLWNEAWVCISFTPFQQLNRISVKQSFWPNDWRASMVNTKATYFVFADYLVILAEWIALTFDGGSWGSIEAYKIIRIACRMS